MPPGIIRFLALVISCLLTEVVVTEEANAASLPLEGATKVERQIVPQGKSAQMALPPLPAKPGKVVVLRFHAVAVTEREAGCNYNMSVLLNDSPLGRYTSGGEERLIGREPMFELKDDKSVRTFPVFTGPQLMLMFAPDANRADATTTDGLGATFLLDISDVAHGVDGNTLALRNTRHAPGGGKPSDVVVEDIEIGWLDKAALPQPKSEAPARGAIAEGVGPENLRLLQGKGGGFALRTDAGMQLMVETGVGMKGDTPSDLIADDAVPKERRAEVAIEKWGPSGYRVTAKWCDIRMVRTIESRDGLLHWAERWTNTGDEILGVPFRHRVFLNGDPVRFRLAGDADVSALANSACNPTLFLESKTRRGNGFGVAAESDWLRLLMWLRARGGVGEIYSETLALAPGSSIDFALTVTPVGDGGGYWTFINALRRRWGVNSFCVERPVFWGYAHATDGKTPEEVARKSLGHLGPITVALGPWQRLVPDARVVSSGQYPRLPAGAPRAPGVCPDFDVETFLTFKHREASWQKYAEDVAAIHRACPQAQVIQMMHPSMETVYKPMQDCWPWAAQAIIGVDGKPFEVYHYSLSWLHDYVKKDWGVLYYVPRPGSAYLAEILREMKRSLDACGSDGIYCDEFSWAGRRRDYSRYDYSRWDGYSADLDADGNVLRLKCDNAFVTESCQLQVTGEVLRRGKFFLGNGAAALRSVNSLPIARFIEGGNGYGYMSDGHLAAVPLVLGNMGDQTTKAGVFESVKSCLSNGCIYSPMAVNLLLDGLDNFVCKLHPITVREIGPGCVKGEERLITTISGSYDWPGRAASVRLYRYDAKGDLVDRDTVLSVNAVKKLDLDVPKQGLVIAEVLQ